MNKSYITSCRGKEVTAVKIQTLEYFIALAESRSINEAAQKLYVAQPSLTKSLQLFEKEIGVQLFDRAKSGITLTEAGEKILPEAVQMVEYYNNWLHLSDTAALRTVKLYTNISLCGFLLPDIILHFRERHPDLTIDYAPATSPEIYISRDLQNPVVSLSMYTPEDCEKYAQLQGNPPLILAPGEYGCLVNRKSPLAEKGVVSLDELRDYYFILPMMDMSPGPGNSLFTILHDIIDVVSHRQVMQVESTNSVIEMIQKHSEAYALSYYPALNRYSGVANGELVYVPFRDYDAKRSLCLFYSEQACRRHPLMRELIADIRHAANQFLSECSTPLEV